MIPHVKELSNGKALPARDDAHKLHPCLVPYDDLPENEKAYDRNTAMETLKLIMKLGFKIENKEASL